MLQLRVLKPLSSVASDGSRSSQSVGTQGHPWNKAATLAQPGAPWAACREGSPKNSLGALVAACQATDGGLTCCC